jgi:hypothetical protein
LKSYECYFDIDRGYRILDWTVPAFARFYSRNERYVLTKRAKLWSAEAYEYLFFFCESELTLARWEEIRDLLVRSEGFLVKPHSEHMYSYISAVILCERMEPAVRKAVGSFRFQKNYRFSFFGWMTARTAAVCLTDGQTACNKPGKDILNHLKKVLKAGEANMAI